MGVRATHPETLKRERSSERARGGGPLLIPIRQPLLLTDVLPACCSFFLPIFLPFPIFPSLQLARQIGEQLDDDTLLEMIDEFDLDGDGEIDEQEFLQIMTNDDIEC